MNADGDRAFKPNAQNLTSIITCFLNIANLFRQYFQMSFIVSSSNFHHQHCLQEHRDVFELIRERDPEKAAETVRILLEHADEDVKSVLQKQASPRETIPVPAFPSTIGRRRRSSC